MGVRTFSLLLFVPFVSALAAHTDGTVADYERSTKDPEKEMVRILERRAPLLGGEPGATLAQLNINIREGIANAKAGDAAALHEELDRAKGGDLTQRECEDVDFYMKKHFLSAEDQAHPAIKKVLEMRAIPTEDLAKRFQEGKEIQDEFWRRARKLTQISGGLFSLQQAGNLIHYYHLAPKHRARLLSDFYGTALFPETIANFMNALASASAFPCKDTLAQDLYTAASILDTNGNLAAQLKKLEMNDRLAALENSEFGKSFRLYLRQRPWNDRIFNDMMWPSEDTLEQMESMEKSRQAFLSTFRDRNPKENVVAPTLTEFVRQLSLQSQNKGLSENTRKHAESRIRDVVDLIAFQDKKGERFLMVGGKKVALSPMSQREDFVWVAKDIAKDVPVIQALDLSKDALAIPTQKEMAGPPPNKEQFAHRLAVERENRKIFKELGDKTDYASIWNESWQKEKLRYEAIWGQAPNGLFPVNPHPTQATRLDDFEARLKAIEEENMRLKRQLLEQSREGAP